MPYNYFDSYANYRKNEIDKFNKNNNTLSDIKNTFENNFNQKDDWIKLLNIDEILKNKEILINNINQENINLNEKNIIINQENNDIFEHIMNYRNNSPKIKISPYSVPPQNSLRDFPFPYPTEIIFINKTLSPLFR